MSTRIDLPSNKKVELIKDSERNASQRDLAAKYKISKGAVFNILKRKQEYLTDYESNQSNETKRKIKNEMGKKIDNETYSWFVAQRGKNLPISGPILQEKARQIAAELDDKNDFMASNGWLQKFKIRHGISYRAICGEATAVSPVTLMEWMNRLPTIINGYNCCDIFNADETGLFFKALPDKSLVWSKDECKGGKKSKGRFTVLLYSNWDGSEKLKPLVIGKSLKPRCFKHVNIQKLPVEWTANRTAWMNVKVFENWLMKLNASMKKQNRQILLFLDNAPCHPIDLQLSNIKLQFFPANTTSVIQPLDQGVIHSFKTHYRRSLVKHIIASASTAQTASDIIITALDSIFWIESAWKSVSETTIKNTFKKAGFFETATEDLSNDLISDVTGDSSSTLIDDSRTVAGVGEEIQMLDELLKHITVGGSIMTVDEYINIDSNIPTFNEWNDSSEKIIIVDSVDQLNESEDEEDEYNSGQIPPKLSEAIEIVQRLRLFSITQCPQVYRAISDIEFKLTDIYLDSKSSVQSTLHSSFRKKLILFYINKLSFL